MSKAQFHIVPAVGTLIRFNELGQDDYAEKYLKTGTSNVTCKIRFEGNKWAIVPFEEPGMMVILNDEPGINTSQLVITRINASGTSCFADTQ